MPPFDLLGINLDNSQYTSAYLALIRGDSWNLKEPNQDDLNIYSTQIKFHEDAIIRLRRKYNAELTVFRIPSEILSEIFLYCISGRLAQRPLYAPGTFNFIHVCWYWKAVAYENPHLWSTWPGGCIDAWPILHARSKNAPLDIHPRNRPTDPTALLPILYNPETFRRLRTLDFDGHVLWLEQFLEYFLVHNHENVPNLESLRIDISSMGVMPDHEPFERISRFFTLSFPKLQTLEIVDLRFNWNSAFLSLSSITELTIRNPLNANHPKMEELLSLLRNNPQINKLTLEDGALPRPGDPRGEGGPLELSGLRSLLLSGGLLPIMRLLENLRLPPELRYAAIAVGTTGYSDEAILQRIKPFLHGYYLSEEREERQIHGLRLCQGDMLTIATTPNAFLVTEATPSQIADSSMNLHIQSNEDSRPLSMEVFQFLPLDNLRDLSLEYLRFTVQQCKLLFSQVRRVEVLCLAEGSGPGAIAALELPSPPGKDKQTGKDKGRAAGTPANPKKKRGKPKGGKDGKQSIPSTSHDARHTITPDSVPLPKLKNLQLYQVVFGSGDGKKYKGIPRKKLGNLVRSRKKAGHGLQGLVIRACVGFGASQVKECEKFVKKVVWDGDEGNDLTHGYAHHHPLWDLDDLSLVEELDAYYQAYGPDPWDAYDSDGLDDFLPPF